MKTTDTLQVIWLVFFVILAWTATFTLLWSKGMIIFVILMVVSITSSIGLIKYIVRKTKEWRLQTFYIVQYAKVKYLAIGTKDKTIQYITSVRTMNVDQEYICQGEKEMFYIVKDFMTGWGN